VAAHEQPSHRRRRWIVVALVFIALVALGFPASAGAHPSALVNALDFRAVVGSVGRSGDGLSARIFDADRKIELSVPASTTVVVLGYAGEPFLRFAPIGVEMNERSLSAIANKLVRAGSVPALDSGSTPTWSVVAHGHRFAWHDHRLGPIPGRVYGEGNVGGWSIPIVVDGRHEAISGRLLHASGPPIWPWLAFGATTLVIATLLARSSQRMTEIALDAGAIVAAVAAAVLSISFEFVPGRPASAGWTNLVVCIVLAASALALFFRLPSARHAIAGFVALLAMLVGLSEASVLVHGFVISSLPTSVVRGATAIAVGFGAIAAVCSAGLLFREGSRPRFERRRLQPPQMAIPRGRQR
jgi:hypothetical protein